MRPMSGFVPNGPPRAWPWLLAAALLLSILPGRMALLDPDEGRYAAAAREMAATGDLIVPRFNGEPRLNKPPLLYWLQAGAFTIVGAGEAAARMPSLLAGLATLALVVWFARRRLGAGSGGPAAAALATTLLFFSCARLGITDMLLTSCVTATLLLWREAARETEATARRRLAWAAALACGLAALAKGPVGIVLPALVILAMLVSRRVRAGHADRLVTWRGVAMGAAGIALVAGPWVAGLMGRIGAAGILDLIRREAIERAAWGLDHPRPFYYLLATFWGAFLPWSIALAVIVTRVARAARAARAERGRRSEGGGAVDVETEFLLVWLGVVLLFFTAMKDKNDAYLLPAAPALALLVGRHLSRRVVGWVAAVTGLALVAAILLAAGRLSSERSLKEAALSANLAGRGQYELISYRLYKPSLVFYSGRSARWVASGGELVEILKHIGPERAAALVMTRRRLETLPQTSPEMDRLMQGFETVGEQPGYVVLFREAGEAPPHPP
jgi:4-amino-4-deoxy-L-arabinose transferase-like glycosyltransferase